MFRLHRNCENGNWFKDFKVRLYSTNCLNSFTFINFLLPSAAGNLVNKYQVCKNILKYGYI
jgi:hypothetical protein